MSSFTNKQANKDLKQLMENYRVEMVNYVIRDFVVHFHGPEDSLYEGGVWRVRVRLQDDYPNKPPIVIFRTKIYHPNIDLYEGDVCVDALDDKWIPKFNLVTVFKDILPGLLKQPTPEDALNVEAGELMNRNVSAYNLRVKEYCDKYAKPEYVVASTEEEESSVGALSKDSDSVDSAKNESGNHSHSIDDAAVPTGDGSSDGGSIKDSDNADGGETQSSEPSYSVDGAAAPTLEGSSNGGSSKDSKTVDGAETKSSEHSHSVDGDETEPENSDP